MDNPKKMKIQSHSFSPGSTAARSIAPVGPGSLAEEEPMELKENFREPDIEEMEVDTIERER